MPLNPGIPTIDAFGLGQTPGEHFRKMLAFYTRRIEADPQDAYAYSGRAQYHDCLGDRARATADMRRWSAAQCPELPGDSIPAAPRSFRRVIGLPFDCQFVFSAERPVNEISMMSVAFGQKGRCEMKQCKTPAFVASLLGLCVVSSVDPHRAYADFTFGERVNLRSVIPILDPALQVPVCFSTDWLEMYVVGIQTGGYGGPDTWVSSRATTDSEWGPLDNLGPNVNTSVDDSLACTSPDGLTLYWDSKRPGGYGDYDVYMSKRETKDAPWGPAINLGPTINSYATDASAWVSPDNLELYFASYRSGGYGSADIYVAKRVRATDPWGHAENLGPTVNSPYTEQYVSLSPDGLLMFFCEPQGEPVRPGGYGGCDCWMTRRANLSAPWQSPVNLGPRINGATNDLLPRMSPDGRTFYFESGVALDFSTYENWTVPIIPICDFTGDGKVDGKELLTMAVQFGGNDPLCDIGPYAWGDGVVDVEDLKVFAEYIGEEIVDGSLVAHWALDETEGMTAHDSAGDHDAMIMGNPTWQPDGGKVGGALAFDGTGDFLFVNANLRLDDGPFSVLAWVQGGAPGQVVLSHSQSGKWLCAHSVDGTLMTLGPGQSATSEAVITDGQWHRIGLVWDGMDKILYVAGDEVARAAESELTILDGTLMIGSQGTPDTMWSGLIDDVRIYSRVVRP